MSQPVHVREVCSRLCGVPYLFVIVKLILFYAFTFAKFSCSTFDFHDNVRCVSVCVFDMEICLAKGMCLFPSMSPLFVLDHKAKTKFLLIVEFKQLALVSVAGIICFDRSIYFWSLLNLERESLQ